MKPNLSFKPIQQYRSNENITKVTRYIGYNMVGVGNDTETCRDPDHDYTTWINKATTKRYCMLRYTPTVSRGLTEPENKNDRKRLRTPHTTGTTAQDDDTFSCLKKQRTKVTSMDHSNHEYDFVDDLLARRDTRRERCRVSQARYRRKQKNYVTDIQAAVTQLGNEIMKLQIDQQMILFGASTKESVWGIAAEYFRVFRHGFISHTALPCSREGMISPQSHVQLKFLQATMSNDVTRGVLRGVHALLENWRLFTMYHSDVQLNLERLDGGPRGSVVATGTTVITITENTLRNLYPHLLIGDAIWTPLARRLLNQRIEMATSICFGWDESSRCVTRLDTKIDMLTPMLRILGSLKILAHVFNGARISLEDVLIRAQ